jgi:hypothetical protein
MLDFISFNTCCRYAAEENLIEIQAVQIVHPEIGKFFQVVCYVLSIPYTVHCFIEEIITM